MKKKLVKILFAMFVVSVPVGAMAMSHDHGDHGKKAMKMEDSGISDMKMEDHGDHGAMMMKGDMAMLGDEVKDDVKGFAHIKDVSEAMARMGMKENYHFMIMFMDTKTGKPIETGTAAVKITDPAGKDTAAPVELMAMDGHFGADILLDQKGEYHFKVGTKLPDGKKRQYDFKFSAK